MAGRTPDTPTLVLVLVDSGRLGRCCLLRRGRWGRRRAGGLKEAGMCVLARRKEGEGGVYLVIGLGGDRPHKSKQRQRQQLEEKEEGQQRRPWAFLRVGSVGSVVCD